MHLGLLPPKQVSTAFLVSPPERTPVVGRKEESLRLHQAIRNRESLLICGPAGIGKTTLVAKVFAELPEVTARAIITVDSANGLQPFLRNLVHKLHDAGDATLRKQLRAEGAGRGRFRGWLKNLSTSRLKGAIYRSMQAANYWVFLDHFPRVTLAVAKVIRDLIWMRHTPVYLVVRGSGREEAGQVAKLYWSDRQRLLLQPLDESSARDLLELCIRRFGLADLDLDDFRRRVLLMSGRNPGALVKMCELAAEPRYQQGSQIKIKLIHIDNLMSLNGRDMQSRAVKGGRVRDRETYGSR
jgi:hypothetical protein